MKAREVMVKAPVTLPVDATIHEAAMVMDGATVGAIVILDGERPVGLVTDRDLVTRALAQGLPPDARVDGVMSSGVVCVDVDATCQRSRRSCRPIRSAVCRWWSTTASWAW